MFLIYVGFIFDRQFECVSLGLLKHYYLLLIGLGHENIPPFKSICH